MSLLFITSLYTGPSSTQQTFFMETRNALRAAFIRGVHPPRGNDAFPPCFGFPPYFRQISQTPRKFSQFSNFTFNRKISRFSSAKTPKFLMTFFSRRLQSLNFHIFSLFHYISSLFRENYYFPPTFTNFSPVF